MKEDSQNGIFFLNNHLQTAILCKVTQNINDIN